MVSYTLSPNHASVRRARLIVAEQAKGRVDVGDAMLLASELVSNVVQHAQTEIRLRVDPGPPFRVEVHDHAAATVAFRKMISEPSAEPSPGALGGRGILLVHKIALRLGLDDDPEGGKVVWFEL